MTYPWFHVRHIWCRAVATISSQTKLYLWWRMRNRRLWQPVLFPDLPMQPVYSQVGCGRYGKGDVRFVTDASLKSEAYSLEVSPEEIIVKASGDKGFFYALQTIRQLLPASIERESLSDKKEKWSIPAMNVQDEPRFEYRALLLDASRFYS